MRQNHVLKGAGGLLLILSSVMKIMSIDMNQAMKERCCSICVEPAREQMLFSPAAHWDIVAPTMPLEEKYPDFPLCHRSSQLIEAQDVLLIM